MGHSNETMNGRYVHVPDQELIAAINKMPWIEFTVPDYTTWVRSKYGRAA